MVKKAIVVTSLVVLLSAGAAGAESMSPQLHSFVSAHGDQSSIKLDEANQVLEFAGNFTSVPMTPEPDTSALMFLESWSELMGFDPLLQLGPANIEKLAGLTYARFDQTHLGIPVEGADVVVTVDGAGRVLQVSSGFKHIDEFASELPALSSDQATEIVAGDMAWLTPTGQFRAAWMPMSGAAAPLVWVIRCQSSQGPEAPEVYVDAHTGEILWARDTNVYYRLGNVYDPNPVTMPTPVEVTLPNLTSDSYLVGTYARAWRCTPGSGWDMCPGRERLASPDGSGDYLYDPLEPSTTEPFAEVMGYYHMDKINTHMEDTYGHVMTCDGHRWIDVHVNMDYENAWFGDQDGDGCSDVTIGQGTYDYSYDAAILYHEFGHGINHSLNRISGWAFDGLGPDHSPQGIDEGFADYWAASFIGESLIGAYAGLGTPGELGIRDVGDFATCPEGLYGEGHYDSPILSTTLWDIREDIGQAKADRLALAVLSGTSREVDFDEAGRALISQASALQSSGVLTPADVTVVEDAVAAHTLVGCERILPMENDDQHIFLATGYGGADVPSGVQFSVYAPPTATRVSVYFDQLSIGGGYTVYVNRDAPVHFTLSGWSITIDDYDYRFEDSPERVTMTEWSDPAVEQDVTYYYTYVHNSQTMALGVDVTVVAPEPPDVSTDTIMPDIEEDTVEDSVADVPVEDVIVDPIEDTVVTPDAEIDTPGGEITEVTGCGCSIVR